LPNDKQAPKELKVTDKRIFTADGEIRDEFKQDIQPADNPQAARPAEPPPKTDAGAERHESADAKQPPREERRRSMNQRGESPGTPFANFIQSLVMQAYMFLGMLRDPRSAQPMFDAQAARETIDILTLLREKTAGNLTPDEEEFFEAHIGELKLAFVQRTKSI
jgi:hypothetical protein